jgi:hypothetical protein
LPTIKDFGGYKIVIYAEDHNPPHVHVIGPDFQAKVRISDAVVMAGAIPLSRRREALSWVEAKKDLLMETWRELC